MVLGGWILLNLAGVVSGGLVPVTYHNGLHLYELKSGELAATPPSCRRPSSRWPRSRLTVPP